MRAADLAARQRLVPVRLCDVPPIVRLQHAKELAKYERKPEAKRELLEAAIFPSDRIYFIPAEAA